MIKRTSASFVTACWLAACSGADKQRGAATPQMASFTDGGYELSGGEYWPYVDDRDVDYPKEVLWGFYPKKGIIAPDETDPNVDDASPAAVACAERAFAELRGFIKSNPADLRSIVSEGEKAGYSNKFYLWTNDYTRAKDPFTPGVRPSHLWYWKRKVPKAGRPPGFWKWESTLNQKGQCMTPDLNEAKKYLATSLANLRDGVASRESCEALGTLFENELKNDSDGAATKLRAQTIQSIQLVKKAFVDSCITSKWKVEMVDCLHRDGIKSDSCKNALTPEQLEQLRTSMKAAAQSAMDPIPSDPK
jgi:hypothetical protein